MDVVINKNYCIYIYVLPEQDYVPKVTDQLRQAAEAGNEFDFFFPEEPRPEVAEYQFWGKSATGSEGTCLVSYSDFLLSAYSRIEEPSSLPHPSDANFMSCEDFFLLRPPTPPQSSPKLAKGSDGAADHGQKPVVRPCRVGAGTISSRSRAVQDRARRPINSSRRDRLRCEIRQHDGLSHKFGLT